MRPQFQAGGQDGFGPPHVGAQRHTGHPGRGAVLVPQPGDNPGQLAGQPCAGGRAQVLGAMPGQADGRPDAGGRRVDAALVEPGGHIVEVQHLTHSPLRSAMMEVVASVGAVAVWGDGGLVCGHGHRPSGSSVSSGSAPRRPAHTRAAVVIPAATATWYRASATYAATISRRSGSGMLTNAPPVACWSIVLSMESRSWVLACDAI